MRHGHEERKEHAREVDGIWYGRQYRVVCGRERNRLGTYSSALETHSRLQEGARLVHASRSSARGAGRTHDVRVEVPRDHLVEGL